MTPSTALLRTANVRFWFKYSRQQTIRGTLHGIPPSSCTLSQLVSSFTLVAITETLQTLSLITTKWCSRPLVETKIPVTTTVLPRISEETGTSTVPTLTWISVSWQELTRWPGNTFLLLTFFLAATCGWIAPELLSRDESGILVNIWETGSNLNLMYLERKVKPTSDF